MNTWLIAVRGERKLSQKEVAGRVGIAQATYSNIENGKRRPSVDVAKRIAAVLGFGWTRFYEDEDARGA